MRDITPLHLNPDAIPEPWKRPVLREPSFVHPLAIAGYKAYPSVQAFADDIRTVIRAMWKLAYWNPAEWHDFAAVAREYTAWAEQEGLL